ncbi:hypothetical protein GCM10020295_78860 [Streptomyces cinereospinus]
MLCRRYQTHRGGGRHRLTQTDLALTLRTGPDVAAPGGIVGTASPRVSPRTRGGTVSVRLGGVRARLLGRRHRRFRRGQPQAAGDGSPRLRVGDAIAQDFYGDEWLAARESARTGTLRVPQSVRDEGLIRA